MSVLNALKRLTASLGPEISATLDPRDINPPSAWIAGRRADEIMLGNRPTLIVADVYLITRDAGIPTALAALDEMLDTALDKLAAAGIGVESISLDESITIPSGGAPLPAYRLTVQVIGE